MGLFGGKKNTDTFAVVSNIQGNLEAFRAIITDINKRNINDVYVLGSLIGYCADGADCINLLCKHKYKFISGPFDTFRSDYGDELTNLVQLINESSLTIDQKNWLEVQSPLYQDDIFLSCGSPVSASQFITLDKVSLVQTAFDFMKTEQLRLGCVSTSVRAIYYGTDPITYDSAERSRIDRKKRSIIGVASAGLPLDENPQTKYSIIHRSKNVVEQVCLDYDINETQEKVRKSKRPNDICKWLGGLFD